jgi:hypothetical protein
MLLDDSKCQNTQSIYGVPLRLITSNDGFLTKKGRSQTKDCVQYRSSEQPFNSEGFFAMFRFVNKKILPETGLSPFRSRDSEKQIITQ